MSCVVHSSPNLATGILRWCPSRTYESSLSRPCLWIHCIQWFVYVETSRCSRVPHREFLSAVTHAAITNWQYMEVIRVSADPKCAFHLENSIKAVDLILDQRIFSSRLKALFGLKGLKHDEDFVSMLEVGRSKTPRLDQLTTRHSDSVGCMAG
jgi:hypothetical protein